MTATPADRLFRRVLTALALGVAIGLFLGEYVWPLKIVSDVYVKLLQVTVLPYVLGSVISGLGAQSPQDARRLAVRGGIMLVLFWVATFVIVIATSMAYPTGRSSDAFVADPPPPDPIDWIGLYIPSNVFHASRLQRAAGGRPVRHPRRRLAERDECGAQASAARGRRRLQRGDGPHQPRHHRHHADRPVRDGGGRGGDDAGGGVRAVAGVVRGLHRLGLPRLAVAAAGAGRAPHPRAVPGSSSAPSRRRCSRRLPPATTSSCCR